MRGIGIVNEGRSQRIRRAVVLATTCFVALAASASGASAQPDLKIFLEQPNTALPGEQVVLTVDVINVGDTTTSGPLTFVDTAGSGIEYMKIEPGIPSRFSKFETSDELPGDMAGSPSCVVSGLTGACSIPWILPPGDNLELPVRLSVPPGATGVTTNMVSLSGGGLSVPVSEEESIEIGPRGPFAFANTLVELMSPEHVQVTQAGSDPAEFNTILKYRSFAWPVPHFPGAVNDGDSLASDEHLKDVHVTLPPGFIGNPTVAPRCTAQQLVEEVNGGSSTACPVDSQVGVVHIEGGTVLFKTAFVPLYNMQPPPGVATELGFNVLGSIVLLDATLLPDHAISVLVRNTTTTIPIIESDVIVWGTPADHVHDWLRGTCDEHGASGRTCPSSITPPKAFLRMPTSCTGQPLAFEANVNSYEHPDNYIESTMTDPPVTGCNLLPFAPGINVEPTGTAADSPTGVSVKLASQQNSNPEGLQAADLKKAVVTLPEGMALNPSAADGLQACTDAQLNADSTAPAECPNGSKVGTVLLHTPLLEEPIEGNVFVLTQNSSDPMSGEMFRLGVELVNTARGIDIKLLGHVQADPKTGRLTSTFDENPQLPFNDVSLQFQAGARAPLTTPASCEPQTTEAEMYSWAEPTIPVHRSMTFQLTSGPEGTPCVSHQGFSPGFSAGVSSVQAGGFTPFLTTFVRHDADQGMQRVSVKLPFGVSGSLTGLPLCPEAQASTGTCSQASEIGTVTAGAGSGPTPFYVTGGKVFMTGPYEGAPFGLSIVVPAKAGPYNLGNVNVRAKVEVDPHTAQLTVTSDPLPLIVSGVPVNIRLVNVTVNRPNFTFNPTSCDPLSVTGTMTGQQGAVATVSNHFQVTNCGALAFKPVFKVSTPGKTSRQTGAGLDVKLSYPALALGRDANIAKVKVDLPKQLPSRLTTLQKACPAATFAANPATCPPGSRVGTATASTPTIPVPLSGPAYFVSHGGEAFPNLVLVLQGYGVTVDLVGDTFINEKTNVTSSTFKTVPDVPVGAFELKLPQGPDSALAANGNLCTSKLSMPTSFVAQDGAEIHQATPIVTSGCHPELAVERRVTKGSHAVLTISVPEAGRLTVTGNAIKPLQRLVAKPGAAKVQLALTAAGQHFLSSHPQRRLVVHVKIALAPKHGPTLTRTVALLMR
jgi:hypothetical protein